MARSNRISNVIKYSPRGMDIRKLEDRQAEDLANFLSSHFMDENYEQAIASLRYAFLIDKRVMVKARRVFDPFLKGKWSSQELFQIVFYKTDFFVQDEEEATNVLHKICKALFD